MDEEITPIYTLFDRDRPGPTLKLFRLTPPPRYGVDWKETVVPSEVAARQTVAAAVTLQNLGNLSWPSEGYNWKLHASVGPGTGELRLVLQFGSRRQVD